MSRALLARAENRTTIETAVRGLEQASRLAPTDARSLSDLAAGYLLLAQEKDDPFDLVLGLDAADRAVAAKPSLLEARFNRALLLEKLFLPVDAWRAWQDYLRRDDQSDWAREAEARADALIRPSVAGSWEQRKSLLGSAALHADQATVETIVATDRQASREYAEQELLSLWAEAWASGRSLEAARPLTIARAIGSALANQGGDHLVDGSVAAVDRAITRKDGKTLQDLADGYRSFRTGWLLYKRYVTQQALVDLSAAQDSLARAGSPLAGRAALFIACGEDHLNHFAEAEAQLDTLWQASEGLQSPSLLGHVTWMRGLLRVRQGDPIEAMGYYRRALDFFQQIDEKENIASLNSLTAEALDQLGRNREAWMYRYRALRVVSRLRDPQLLYINLATVAQAAFHHHREAIALYYQNELVRRVTSSDNPTLLAGAYLWRGLILNKVGDQSRALRDLDRARGEAQREQDESIRRDLEADLSMIEGEVSLATDPGRAVGLLNSALEVYEGNQHFLLSMMAHRARVHAYRATGDVELAAAEIRSGLKSYEKLGKDSRDETIRIALIARTMELFDEAISFEALERRRPDLAFAYADLARTRVLPVAVASLPAKSVGNAHLLRSETGPLSLEEIRRALPEDTALVQYWVLSDRVLIWLIQRQGLEPFEAMISLEQLRASMERSRRSAQDTRDLFARLIAPWLQRIGPHEKIVFAPDGILDGVPFSVLRASRSAHYLVEDHEIVVTPSASLYARAAARAESFPKVFGNRPGLILGNPRFDRGRFQGLDELHFAEGEARTIAGMYPDSHLLVGRAVTRKAFLEVGQKASWLHFAGHAIVNRDQPLLSLLVLAPSPDGDKQGAVVYAREIYELDFSSTPLVVLSACSTAEEVDSGDGSSNLARAFLAAGARDVVASLWPVDDRATSKLFATFYEHLRIGEDPVRALRSAQLRLLKQSDPPLPPGMWGGFEVITASR